MKKTTQNINKFVTACLAIEEKSAKAAKTIGFMARGLVLATMPHTNPNSHVFRRKNGNHTLTMIANPQFGLPFGALPRVLLAWLTREAKNRNSPVIYLGKTLTNFLDVLKLSRNGGARGDITRLRDQMLRLLTTQISCVHHDKKKGVYKGEQFLVARSFELWSRPLNENESDITHSSSITLSKDFFEELICRPVPIDLRALNAFRRSPLQMDLYIWLTYRFSRLRHPTLIQWKDIQNQFGSNYSDIRGFKKGFLNALHAVSVLYHQAKVEITPEGIILKPSPTHIQKKVRGD